MTGGRSEGREKGSVEGWMRLNVAADENHSESSFRLSCREEASSLHLCFCTGRREGDIEGGKETLKEGRKETLTEGRKETLTEGHKETRKETLEETLEEGCREFESSLILW